MNDGICRDQTTFWVRNCSRSSGARPSANLMDYLRSRHAMAADKEVVRSTYLLGTSAIPECPRSALLCKTGSRRSQHERKSTWGLLSSERPSSLRLPFVIFLALFLISITFGGMSGGLSVQMFNTFVKLFLLISQFTPPFLISCKFFTKHPLPNKQTVCLNCCRSSCVQQRITTKLFKEILPMFVYTI